VTHPPHTTMSIHAGQAPAVETSDGTAPVQKENENTVTTVEFRASYALGGLCTPPPPHFDAVFPQELQHRVRPCGRWRRAEW